MGINDWKMFAALAVLVLIVPTRIRGQDVDVYSSTTKLIVYIHGSTRHYGGLADGKICFPVGFNAEQLTAVFLKWAEANPNQWHLKPIEAVGLAFQDAWPCPDTP